MRYPFPSLDLPKIFTLLLGLFLISSCATRKQQATYSTAEWGQSRDALIEGIAQRSAGWTSIRGTWQGEISRGSKDFSSRINVSAVRGQGIQLSVVPFPLIEAARAWFTPEGIIILDVINKRYVEETYTTLSARLGFGIDYGQIEALFFGQLFAPGAGSSLDVLRRMNITTPRGSDTGRELTGTGKGFGYRFALDDEALVRALSIIRSGRENPSFTASYSGALGVAQAIMPEETTLVIHSDSGAEQGKLHLVWSKLSEADPTLTITPSIRSGYQRVSLDAVLSLLDKL